MAPRTTHRIASFALVAALVAAPGTASAAAPNDKDVLDLIQGVFEVDYLNTRFDEALEKLEFAKQACEGSACSPSVRGKVYIALGTVLAGGKKKVKEAEQAFATALREDPTATLFGDYITSEVQKAFNDARGRASASGGSPEAKGGAAPPRTKKTFAGGAPPRGWHSAEASFYYLEAVRAEGERSWAECAGDAQASLALENRVQTRFLAASCEEKAGLWIEALGDYRIVADKAPSVGLRDAARKAKERADDLSQKIPKIVLRRPAKAQSLVVKMNDVEVPEDKLDGEIWVNPGQRAISAVGRVDGAELVFDQVIDVGEFETTTVDIKLVPRSFQKADQAAIKCMSEAKTREELARCVGGSSASLTTGLDLRFGSELSAYHDSDHVDVVTPAFYASVENPTAGWGFGGSMLVDVVTAASADIVATASPRWTEVRYVPSARGHKKLGDADLGLKGNLSLEPDYLATSVGASASIDLAQKTITPSFDYEFSRDVSGRSGTRFDVFSRTLTRHGLDLATTFVLDRATFLGTSVTAVFESGDGSKPYRYVPMFSADIAPRVQPGQSIESVNAFRSPERVLEQLPTERQRWAFAGRLAHRFTSTTLRAEERIYTDDWGLLATTTDASYLIDLTQRLRVWPHLRFHAQTAVDFWQLAYVSTLTPTGGQVPALRTGDRELGPLYNLTLGGGARYAFGEKKNFALTLAADVVYSRYLDHLFILQRVGYFGATTLEVELE